MGLVENLLSLKNHYSQIEREKKLKEQQIAQQKEKLSIDRAKVDSNMLLNKAKAQESLNKSSLIKSETLGQNITNTGQKIENMQAIRDPALYGVDTDKLPKKQGVKGVEGVQGVKTAQPVQNPMSQEIGANELPPNDPLAYQPGQASSVPGGRPAPQPFDLTRHEPAPAEPTIESLEDTKDKRRDLMDKYIEQNKTEQKIRDDFSNARKLYSEKLRSIDTEFDNLQRNPPTYRSALSSMNMVKKVGALLHANFFGDLYKSPTEFLDKMVNQELFDQQQIHKGNVARLRNNQTLYEKFLDLTKDEESAELATKVSIRQNLEREMQQQALISQDTDSQRKTQQAIVDFNLKNTNDMNSINQKLWEKEESGVIKRLTARREEDKLLMKKADETIHIGNDPNTMRSFRVGKQQAKKFNEDISKGTDVIRNMYELSDLTKEIKAIRAGGAAIASFPGGLGDKELRIYETINKSLKLMSLKSRIDFTGGGNMSEYEQRTLRDFYEVKEGFGPAGEVKDATKIGQMMRAKYRGQYDTLFNIIKKSMYYKTIHDAQAGSPLLRKNYKFLFNAVGEQMGLSKDDTVKYLRQYEKNKLKSALRGRAKKK